MDSATRDGNRPLAQRTYHAVMLKFTAFTTGEAYDKTKMFSANELAF